MNNFLFFPAILAGFVLRTETSVTAESNALHPITNQEGSHYSLLGSKAELQLPFLVNILVDGKSTGIGSLIRKNYILTAAHTVYNEAEETFLKLDRIRVTLLTNSSANETSLPVNQINSTLTYGKSSGNEIVLLRTSGSFNLTDSDFAKLPSSLDNDVPNEGVGIYHQNGTFTKQIPLKLHNSASNKYLNISNQIFADSDNNESVFWGNVGGPLKSPNGSEIYGILLYNIKSCEGYSESIYKKVAPYVSWIEGEINKSETIVDVNVPLESPFEILDKIKPAVEVEQTKNEEILSNVNKYFIYVTIAFLFLTIVAIKLTCRIEKNFNLVVQVD